MSRCLGAEAVGLYQICLSVYFLTASFSASGLPLVLSRKIAEDEALNGKLSNRYLSASILMSLGVSVFFILVFLIFKNQLNFIFSDERAMPLFLIMLPALFSTSIYTSVRSWFWGNRDFNAFSFAEMMEEVLRILFGVFLSSGVLSWISGAKGIALAFTISDFICAVILIFMFKRKKGRFEKPYGYRELIKSSAPITAMRSFNGLVFSLTALLIPALLINYGMEAHEATATYGRVAGMAMPLLMAPTTLTGSLAVVLIPDIATAKTENNKNYLRNRIDGSILFSVFISSFFCILYLPLGREVAEIIFNDTFAGEYLSNSAIILYPIGLNQITLSMLNSMGLEKKSFYHFIAGTSALIICILTLPKFIGIYAIAVGSGLCFSITTFLNIRLLSKQVDIGNNLKKIALAVGFMPVCALFAFLLKRLLLPVLPKLLGVIISGGIPMAIYLYLAYSFEIIDVRRFYHKRKPAKIKEMQI